MRGLLLPSLRQRLDYRGQLDCVLGHTSAEIDDTRTPGPLGYLRQLFHVLGLVQLDQLPLLPPEKAEGHSVSAVDESRRVDRNLCLVRGGDYAVYALLREVLSKPIEELSRRVGRPFVERVGELVYRVLELPVLHFVGIHVVEPIDLELQELLVVDEPCPLVVVVAERFEYVLGDVGSGAHEDVDVPLLYQPPDYLPLSGRAERPCQTQEDREVLLSGHLGPYVRDFPELLSLEAGLSHLFQQIGDTLLAYFDCG